MLIRSEAAQYRILVAEDNHVNQALVKAFLKKYHHTLDFAINGKQAVDMVQEKPYDLILMDIQMPEVDGLMATAMIRELPAPLCNIPIIAVTANTLNMQKQDYLNAGMDGFVPKPIQLSELMETIREVMRRHDAIKHKAFMYFNYIGTQFVYYF